MNASGTKVTWLALTTATWVAACGGSGTGTSNPPASGSDSSVSGASTGAGSSGSGSSGSGTTSGAGTSGSASSTGGSGGGSGTTGNSASNDAGCSVTTNVCTRCESVYCCPELDQCANDAQCRAYTACVASCGATVKCYESCNGLHPQSAVKGEQFELCVVKKCASPCGDLARE
jgi:hypothetical protein